MIAYYKGQELAKGASAYDLAVARCVTKPL